MSGGREGQAPEEEEEEKRYYEASETAGQPAGQGQVRSWGKGWLGMGKQEAGKAQQQGGEAAEKAQEVSEETAGRAQEKGGQLKEQAGEFAGQAKEKTSGAAERAKEQVGGKAGEAKERAGGLAEQTKEKTGNVVDQAKERGQEYWEGERGQQIRGQAEEYGQRAGDVARRTKDTAGGYVQQTREGGRQFMTEIKEEGEGEGLGGEIGRRTKQAGRAVQDKAHEIAENPEARQGLLEDAGRFLGAMRAQGGGIGKEAEALGHGAQMISETAQQTWEHVPDEAKQAVVAGGKKLAETTDRLWTKFFGIVERALDLADKKLFQDEEEGEDIEAGQVHRGEEASHPNQEQTGPKQPLLQKPGFLKTKDPRQKERERKEKEKQKRQKNVKLVTQVIGGIIVLLLSTILLFFLGFFLLPILLIALLLVLMGFQCYACCGIGSS